MTNQQVKDFLHGNTGQERLAAIASQARAVAEAAKAIPHAPRVTVDGRGFDCIPGGMCDRFAREVHEAAFDQPDRSWEFATDCAHDTEAVLKAHHREIGAVIPGCVVLWDCRERDGREVGHIVVCIAPGWVAENTSSERGNPSRPGTKVTPLAEVQAAHGGAGRPYYAGPVV